MNQLMSQDKENNPNEIAERIVNDNLKQKCIHNWISEMVGIIDMLKLSTLMLKIKA